MDYLGGNFDQQDPAINDDTFEAVRWWRQDADEAVRQVLPGNAGRQ